MATRTQSTVIVDRDVVVAMRDGTITYADVYRPDGPGPFPVLLQRTPYNKSMGNLALIQTDTFRALAQGYVVVIQDVRGRYTSDGQFSPFHQEILDGYDSVEWCAAQSWSNGKVGMYGTSYVGAVQWLAAIAAPPALKAIAPAFTASDYYEGWTYQGGALQWGFMLNWVIPYLSSADLVRANRRDARADFDAWSHRLAQGIDEMSTTARTLPLTDLPVHPELTAYYREWLAHPTWDAFWQEVSIERQHARVAVPALNIGGWYDIFLDGTVRNFTGVREQGATDAARAGSRLLLGPWTHTTPPSQTTGAVDFGTVAGQNYNPLSMDIDGLTLRFFDRWLKGVDTETDEAPVSVFTMGEDRWRHHAAWPIPGTEITAFYLHSGGSANTLHGDGTLDGSAPGSERPDVYLYDPHHPVPTNGGALCCYPPKLPPGVFDQCAIEERSDVLVYATAPLTAEVEVTGTVRLTLWAATSAADTDFTAKLVDVAPSGERRNLCDGIIRARYRLGTDMARPITPGEPTEYVIDLWSTSNLFRAGHRIAVEVSSSNFPRFDRNLNTGNAIATDTEIRPALQTIFHDAAHPSRLLLPIVPRG
jgi:putative CocE/NonD family hydrolase